MLQIKNKFFVIAFPAIFMRDTWKYIVSATGEEYAIDGEWATTKRLVVRTLREVVG